MSTQKELVRHDPIAGKLSDAVVYGDLVYLAGQVAEDTSLGKITGPGFDEDGIVDAVERVTDKYLELREGEERFLDTYRRVGFDPFKEAIYG